MKAEFAILLTAALPKISRLVATRARPFIATISTSGHVELNRGGARKGSIRRR